MDIQIRTLIAILRNRQLILGLIALFALVVGFAAGREDPRGVGVMAIIACGFFIITVLCIFSIMATQDEVNKLDQQASVPTTPS